MIPAPIPDHEAQRLAALRGTGLLDSPPEPMFDDIARLAGLACGTPIALVSLVDESRQWFKARVGLQATEGPRDQAFCAHAILRPAEVMVVADARADERFHDNPAVAGGPRVCFYAGAPIVAPGGQALGTVCAMDHVPRSASPEQLAALQALARQAAELIAWRSARQPGRPVPLGQSQLDRERLLQLSAVATSELGLTTYVDGEHIVRYVNDRLLAYRALRREEVEGRHFRDLVGALAYETDARPLLEAALQGEQALFTRDVHYAAAGVRRMSFTYLPVRDGSGQVCGVVVRGVDVHEFELARRELEQANARLQQLNAGQARFIQMLSHDLREPINTICSFTGLMVEDLAPGAPPEQARHLRFVHQAGQRMKALVDDLLDYLRLEEDGTPTQHWALVDLDAVMQEALADLQPRWHGTGARLQAGALPQVWGDRSLLRVLLQNLLANALKFHAPAQVPVVSWGAQRQGDQVRVWVRDQGIGIEPALQHKLFGAFSRLVTRREFPGTGLGLAICRRVVALHGGRIEVDSTPGQGSTFSVWLPVAPPAAPGPPP